MKRTTISINEKETITLKNAVKEVAKETGEVLSQSKIINMLIKHKLASLIEELKEKGTGDLE